MTEITVGEQQGRVPVMILQPHGSLDASNYQDLIAKAQQAYNAGAKDILLDLSDTDYMSSSGVVALQSIGALLRGEEPPDPEGGWGAFRAVHRDREAGMQSHFKLLSPQPRVEETLEMIGFDRFLEIHTDLETAVASF
jgi:anti-anti-sigma regulatory factor